jgi:hypothetical protein
LFGTLQTGLDVKTVLEESIGREFQLVEAKLGAASGKLWWFADKPFGRFTARSKNAWLQSCPALSP